MKIVQQLAVFVENQPGTLAALCSELAKQKINILALSISDAIDHAVIRMVVDNTTRALHLLGEHGTLVVERDVLWLECSSGPGTLAAIARKLARAKINIEYAYSATPDGAAAGAMVLRVPDVVKAKRVLKGL